MSLIDVSQFRDRFDIDDTIGDARIELHIKTASRRLRSWVGDANYDQTVDEDLIDILANAEAHLTMHYALLGLNSPLTAKGVINQARSEEGGGREIRTYLKPDETAQLSQQFLEAAREIAEAYITTDGTPSAPFAGIVSTDCEIDTSCEAVTRVRRCG